MSHQTGIKSNAELCGHIAAVRSVSSTVRLLKVKINQATETMEYIETRPMQADWKVDYRTHMGSVITKDEPCYVFYRLDNINDLGYNDWVFILYLPASSGVRNKMLYASSKLTLKNDFGAGIRFDYLADSYEEVLYESFAKWMLSKLAKNVDDHELVSACSLDVVNCNVLSAVEDERRKMKSMELAESMAKKNKNLSNFQFPIHQDAINGLLDFRDGHIVYLKLRVNIANEEIILVDRRNKTSHPQCGEVYDVCNHTTTKNVVLALKDPVSNAGTGFYLLAFHHSDPSSAVCKKNIFVYVMNAEETSIKERISYSACLHSLYDSIANRISIPIDKRLELDDVAEVTVETIANRLYPQLDGRNHPEQGESHAPAAADFNPQALKFSKPKPPNSRRGLIK